MEEEKYLAQYYCGSWDSFETFAECDTAEEAEAACKRAKASDELETQYRVINDLTNNIVC